jgi:Mg2+ and Co2+ transporter CorA
VRAKAGGLGLERPINGYLYVILHGIDFRTGKTTFATHDVDFFIGQTYLVTVHDGHSRSVVGMQENVARNSKIMAEGPVALFHRIIRCRSRC